MGVYLLDNEDIGFPDPESAEPDGLLAVGGDLRPERLLLAYSLGIFPWYEDGSPILWWSPDPRLVLFPKEIKVSRSLRQTLKKDIYEVTFDRAFEDVIIACAGLREEKDEGTWITKEMGQAYTELHRLGHAHSVESWRDGELAGGLYGVAMGRVFCGESMFARQRDASKVALVRLVEQLSSRGFQMIDCQVRTRHLISMGAREIPRREFLHRLIECGGDLSPTPPWIL